MATCSALGFIKGLLHPQFSAAACVSLGPEVGQLASRGCHAAWTAGAGLGTGPPRPRAFCIFPQAWVSRSIQEVEIVCVNV